MAGLLSVRVTAEERKLLKRAQAERGCTSLSQVVRLMLGFPAGATAEPFEGADDTESVMQLARVVLKMIERMDDQHQLMAAIARKVGLPRMKEMQRQELLERVESLPPLDPKEEQVFATRNGKRHPDLPEGFAR